MTTATAAIQKTSLSAAGDIPVQAKVEEGKVRWDMSPRQTLAWQAVQEPAIQEILYGGAKGGGKSVWLCRMMCWMAIEIARKCQLPVTTTPPPVGWMGRLVGKHFKDTTLQTWHRFIPPELYTHNKADQKLVICDRAVIDYGGLDSENATHKFNSAEYAVIGLDQAEEVPESKVDVLRATRRLILNGIKIPSKGLYTANPGPCWLKRDFIQAPREGYRFVQALPGDNPWLGDEYLKILQESFRHRPELLKAYLYGDWSAFEGADQLIRSNWVDKALMHKVVAAAKPANFLVCDPARFGDDECVIYRFLNTDIVEQQIFGKCDTNKLTNFLHIMALARKSQAIVIDSCGLGAPILDSLNAMAGGKYRVIGINSAAKAFQPERYVNTRAEMWDVSARMLEDGEIAGSWNKWMSLDDLMKFHGQLTTPKYDFRGPRIYCTPKEETKEELNSSPDRADTAVMGWYAYQKYLFDSPPKREKTPKRRGARRSSMAA